MTDYEYAGPRIPRTPENEEIVRARFDAALTANVEFKLQLAMEVWAEADQGSFPDKRQITRTATAELEVLCRALDGWAAVDPEEVLGPKHRPQLGGFFD